MTSEWPILKIEDVAERVGMGPFGSSIKVETFVESGVPVISGEHLHDIALTEKKFRFITEQHAKELAKSNVFRGDVVFTHAGTIGQVSVIPENSKYEKYIISQRQFFMRCNRELVNPLYVVYFFKSPQGRHKLLANASQVGVPSIARPVTYLRSIEIPIPSLAVQNRIVEVIESIRDRITLLRETNQTLEAIAQALFKSWFVNFDPVRAKAEGKLPEGIDAATAALFPDAFDETELGLVPRGWAYVPFGELISQTIGGDWGSDVADENNDTRVAIIRGTDIPDLQGSTNNRVPIRFTTQKKLATRKLEEGDLVLEVSGGSKDQPTGRSLHITATLLEKFDCPVEPASFCRLMRPVNKQIGSLLSQHLNYIYAQGKTWEYQNQSTGIANFQTTHFLQNEMVVYPTEAVLNAFAETVQRLMDRTQTLEIQMLSNLRDTLLPRLISGQLRIADAEAELEKATA